MRTAKMRQSLVGLLVALALALGSSAAGAAERPDVIVILADEIGAQLIGPERRIGIPTPAIDGIASKGLTFTHGYGAPVCVPARVGLLTGRYPHRYGIYGNRPKMPASALTIAERLRALGYRTAMVGKWHATLDSPLDHGFDSFFGFIGHSDSDVPYFGNDPNNPLMRQRTVVTNTGYVTDVLADEAVRELTDGTGRPKFLYLAFTAAHKPLQATEELLAAVPASIPDGHKLMAAVIIGLDRAIGRVLAAAKPGTLVFFATDNGRNLGTGNPLRGGKADIYEGGIRVPFLVMQAGTLAPRQTRSTPVGLVDIPPTILNRVGGLPTPELDGHDVLGALPVGRSLVFVDIRQQGSAIRKGRWKLLKDYDGVRNQLYDIREDRGETNNLASSNGAVVDALARELTGILSTR
jgi:arylsulfatase A-like enzyme